MDKTTVSHKELLSKLEQQVQEKDQLLQIVTERLEQAVEQLDRFRREGAHPEFDAPARQSDGLADDEPDLRDDLRQMLADWNNLSQRGWFDQLDQRLELIQERVSGIDAPVAARQSGHSSPSESHGKPAAQKKDDANSYTSSVADILARFGGETPKDSDSKEIPVSGVETSPDTSPAEPIADLPSERMLVPLPPSPVAIDLETADVDALRCAVFERDEHIALLEEYLHTLEATGQQPIEFPTLENLTDEQREVLETWSDAIRKEFRQTQIHTSLERAQLSRETMKLQHRQQLVDSELKRLEMAKKSGVFDPDTDSPGGSKARGWLGLFGAK